MKRACLLLLPVMLMLILAASGCNDDSKPVITRIRVTPTCGVAPMVVDAFAAVSGGNESGDPMGGTNNLEMAWSFGDGATGSTAISYHEYTAPGQYDVTVTAKDPDGNTATASVPVTVLSDTLVVTASSDFPDGNVSTADRVQFAMSALGCDIDFPSVLGDSVKMIFRWEIAGVDTFFGAGPLVQFAVAGDYDVNLTVNYPAQAVTRRTQLQFSAVAP
jgi:hypothetical protein